MCDSPDSRLPPSRDPSVLSALLNARDEDFASTLSRLARRDEAQQFAQREHEAYQKEPLFHSSELDALDKKAEPKNPLKTVLKEKLCLGGRTWRAPESRRMEFATYLEMKRGEVLHAERERGVELEKGRRAKLLAIRTEELYKEAKEKLKKEKRIEQRWHQHRYEEEDALRRDYLQELYGPDVEITDAHDRWHGNLNRRYRGFELGAIGRDNETIQPPVIPSSKEILDPKIAKHDSSTFPKTETEINETLSKLFPRLGTDFLDVEEAVQASKHIGPLIELLQEQAGNPPQPGTEAYHVWRNLRHRKDDADKVLGRAFVEQMDALNLSRTLPSSRASSSSAGRLSNRTR